MIKTDVVIVGAGPVGLFAVHQLGIKGLKSEVIDNLDKAGGQCIELYPDKPIYDIPAVPECSGKSLTDELLRQIKPFKTNFHFNERVQEIKEEKGNWLIKTNKNKNFLSPNIDPLPHNLPHVLGQQNCPEPTTIYPLSYTRTYIYIYISCRPPFIYYHSI